MPCSFLWPKVNWCCERKVYSNHDESPHAPPGHICGRVSVYKQNAPMVVHDGLSERARGPNTTHPSADQNFNGIATATGISMASRVGKASRLCVSCDHNELKCRSLHIYIKGMTLIIRAKLERTSPSGDSIDLSNINGNLIAIIKEFGHFPIPIHLGRRSTAHVLHTGVVRVDHCRP